MWRKLRLILWKNLLIRKRHWFLTLIEIIIPIVLFTLVAYGRSKVSGMAKVHIDEPTYHEINTIDDIYSHLDVGELNLWYSPYTDFTKNIIEKVQQKLQIRGDAVKEFSSKEDLLVHFGKNCSSVVAAVIFNGNDHQKLNYDLTIYDKYFTWNTDRLFVSSFAPEEYLGSSVSSKYLYKGFAALQLAIDMSYMELNLGRERLRNISFTFQEFPNPPRTVDSGLNELFIYFLPLITIFSFIFLCPAVLQRVGEEKASGTKEYMKMVGLNSSLIWLGWFIHALTTNFFSIIVIVVVMKVPFWGVSYPPIEYADGTVLFVFLFLYCMAAITFCFLIASLFNTPSIATVFGVLFWIFSYFIPQTFISSYQYLSWMFKIPFAVLPNMALYYGYSSISVYEMRETGIQWRNIFEPGSGDENDITIGNVFCMLICDMVLFMLLTLYIENVNPGEYGICKSYSFPLTNLKKFLKKLFSRRVNNSPEDPLLDADLEKGKTPCIQIHNLTKKYTNHIAVDNLSIDIWKNYITVLLGQNGAGKTTTMSILTGMTNATEGVVIVNGKDIRKQTDEVRQLMGLCPQHNLLFPDLTVGEHLQFFAMLKDSKNIREDCHEMLKRLGLNEKINDMPNTLSGGMKRKLCLGMALIGNSEVLVLDEPSSGMDPESRRKVWDLLLEYRKTKTILITTHFMEEADVLGDYIAIMANGHLQCYDTPIRLKEKYNTGYYLSLFLGSNQHVRTISEAIKQPNRFPQAKLIQETNDSVVFLLPIVDGNNYKDLITDLEEHQHDWEIIKISMNMTTLNDVFLKAKDEIDGVKTPSIKNGNEEIHFIKPDRRQTIPQSILTKFFALITKRCYFLKTKFYWFIPAILVTICIFMLAVWLTMLNNTYGSNSGPSLNLTLDAYGKVKVYYGGEKSTDLIVNNMRKFYGNIVSQQNGQPILGVDVSKEIIDEGIRNIAFYEGHMVVAAEFNNTEDEIIINSMYSSRSLHGLPISINVAMNAVLKALLNKNFSISISNTPLKPLYSEYAPSELSVVNVTSAWLILIPIGMFFFISNFIIFPNTEVSTDFIQIQIIAGIKAYFYWFTNVFFDFIFSLFPLSILLFILFLLNWTAYNWNAFREDDVWAIIVIVLTYVFVSLPFTYVLSYRKTITGGFTLLLMIGIFTGIIPTLVIAAMEFSRDEYYIKIATYLKPILIIISPHFALSYISVKFAKKYVENFNWLFMDPNKQHHICLTEPNPCCLGIETTACHNYRDYFKNEKLGIWEDLMIMLCGFVFYFGVLLFLNSTLLKKFLHLIKYFPSLFRNRHHAKQELFVNTAESKAASGENSLKVQNLTKTFGTKTIVNNLKFHLKKNKCFGLLGVNGAGKSTTFRILTKYLFFDKGDISLQAEKNQITISDSEYSGKIGYCPQEDCLNYVLTGKQLLFTMACLKNYSRSEAEQVTDWLLDCFDLKQYANKPCSEYSGGNKRKLSSCIAFLGAPEVILLDEPTSGVDPASRRNFWSVLSSFKKIKDTSFLLCSHSMEECENLCDEIAIMKNGSIKDQGSLSFLKNKYQKGFKITIKLESQNGNTQDVKNDIKSQLDAELVEEYAETLTYQVKKHDKRLSELFDALGKLKEKYQCIEDYVVNQISLEDIFLTVAEEEESNQKVDENSDENQ